MSEGLNRVILLGNLGADPELRVTQGGTAVLKLRLATTERFMDRSGTRQERTEWHSVTVFGRRGEALHKYLSKGSRILIEGSLRTSSYEDRDGNKRYRTEVIASNLVFAGGGGGGGGGGRSRVPPTDEGYDAPPDSPPGAPPEPPRASPPDPGQGAPPDPGDDFPNDDDIPF